MMKGIYLFLFLFVLKSCIGLAPTMPYQSQTQSSTNQNNQPKPLNTSPPPLPPLPEPYDNQEESQSNLCTNQNRQAQCKKYCKAMYRNERSAQQKCEKKQIQKIEDLYDIHLKLKDPNEDHLDYFLSDYDLYTEYFDISLSAFKYLIAGYDTREAEEVLQELAENESFAEALVSKDTDYELLKQLLKRFDQESYQAFSKDRFSRNDTLMELAIETRNSKALKWFEDYLYKEECNKKDSKKCLKQFCQIGNAIRDEEDRKDWLRYYADYLKDFLREVIEGRVNAHTNNRWYYDGKGVTIQKLSELPDEDFLALCNKGCTTSSASASGSGPKDLTKTPETHCTTPNSWPLN